MLERGARGNMRRAGERSQMPKGQSQKSPDHGLEVKGAGGRAVSPVRLLTFTSLSGADRVFRSAAFRTWNTEASGTQREGRAKFCKPMSTSYRIQSTYIKTKLNEPKNEPKLLEGSNLQLWRGASLRPSRGLPCRRALAPVSSKRCGTRSGRPGDEGTQPHRQRSRQRFVLR
jgi:hypothetical protein